MNPRRIRLVTILRIREVYNVDGFGLTISHRERTPCLLYVTYAVVTTCTSMDFCSTIRLVDWEA